MRAREEAAAYAGRAWLEMGRRDRRRAVRLMRSAHWRLLIELFALIEKSERRLYPARDARETAEKCSSIFRTQLENKKGKPE